ncbi:MAG: hypothetical protein B6I38_11105 [Anaerolineaceae bacterium 4572_5.1]|nr:MAG: hypothetical protein B6I38_11105 [Anaerolineaceae bacterium 4572_5.1]
MNVYGRGNRRGGTGGGRGEGRGPGRNNGPQKAGPSGYCVCPSCGHKVQHVVGQPCYDKKCAKCGTQMTRE